MIKGIGVIILTFILVIMFITPVRDYMNNLIHKDSENGLKEGQIIGTVSSYNPRVKEIQETLKNMGLYLRNIDGIMGVKTRKSIKEFQKRKGLKPTGKIDSTTSLELNRAEATTKFPIKTITKESDLSVPLNTSKSPINEYLKVDSRHAEEVSKVQEEVLSYRLKSKDRIKRIQIALKKAGFYKGEIDGEIGTQTKRAIKAFQKSKDLNHDGIVGQKTWEELSKYLKN